MSCYHFGLCLATIWPSLATIIWPIFAIALSRPMSCHYYLDLGPSALCLAVYCHSIAVHLALLVALPLSLFGLALSPFDLRFNNTVKSSLPQVWLYCMFRYVTSLPLCSIWKTGSVGAPFWRACRGCSLSAAAPSSRWVCARRPLSSLKSPRVAAQVSVALERLSPTPCRSNFSLQLPSWKYFY